MAVSDLDKLCKPSLMYLFLAIIALIIVVYYNYDSLNFTFCIGEYRCFNTPSKGVLLFINLFYIIIWTFIIEFVCRSEYKEFSWFLVLAPMILFIIFLIFIFGPWRHKKDIFQFMDFKLNRNLNQSNNENKNKQKK